LKDLGDTIKQLHSKGGSVIVAWDANATLESTQLAQFLAETNLESLIPPCHNLTTYARGKQTIDHIIGSTTLASPRRAGYFAFYNGAWPSDHRALFVDFEVDTLFNHHLDSYPLEHNRSLKSTNVSSIRHFLRHIETDDKYDTILQELHKLALIPTEWTQTKHLHLEAHSFSYTQ
jgi:hypothetical protein